MEVSGLMDDHHTKIEELLQRLPDNFDVFKWELEKHFFTEEKAIFMFDQKGDLSRYSEKLLNEHRQILDMLERLKHDKGLLEEFKQLLTQHKEFEDNELYPMLDEMLGENDKKYIIDRFTEAAQEFEKQDKK